MIKPTHTSIVAECGCRYKVVSSLPVLTTGGLELETICVVHSQARTKYLNLETEKNLRLQLKRVTDLLEGLLNATQSLYKMPTATGSHAKTLRSQISHSRRLLRSSEEV